MAPNTTICCNFVLLPIESKKDFERLSMKRLIEIEDKGSVATVPTPPLAHYLSSQGFSLVKNFKQTGVLESFIIKSSMLTEAKSIEKVDKLNTVMGQFISRAQVLAAKRHLNEISMVKYLPNNNKYYQTLKDYYKTVPFLYVVMAKCDTTKKRCVLSLEVENAF